MGTGGGEKVTRTSSPRRLKIGSLGYLVNRQSPKLVCAVRVSELPLLFEIVGIVKVEILLERALPSGRGHGFSVKHSAVVLPDN